MNSAMASAKTSERSRYSTQRTAANPRRPSPSRGARLIPPRRHRLAWALGRAEVEEIDAIIDAGTRLSTRVAKALGDDGAARLDAARRALCGADDSVAAEARYRYGLIRAALGSMQRRAPVLMRWRDRLLREGTEAVAAFEAETGQAESGLTGLLADYAVATSDRAEKTLRREIFRRVHEILVKIAR